MSRAGLANMARRGTWLAITGIVGLALGAGMASSVAAYDGQSWMRFSSAQQVRPNIYDPYDRQFARQWEANPPKGYPTISRDNIAAMKGAIKRYEAIVARGGWRPVPGVTLQAGISHPAVVALRDRLVMSGDLKEDATFGRESYDYYVERAVRRFQASNGLTPTGIVDKRTIAALNVSAQARLRQLKLNLGRVSELARTAAKRYVLVNIPAAQIEAIENDKVVTRHAGVVGKIDRKTPILRSHIHELNFNPVWHLPPTVIQKDLIPKGREMQKRGQDVLAKYKIDAYGANGKKLDSSKINWSTSSVQGLTYRQQPGPENPMGFVKINFHNSYSVYLHDTPSESIFGRNFRAASSGCVRVQNVETLVSWLLNDNGWTHEKVLAVKKSGEREDVRVKKPVPLYFAYITAWATEDGIVQFRRDLYRKDGVGELASAY